MRALLVAPVTPSPRCCPSIVHCLCDLRSLGTLLSIFVHHRLDVVQALCIVQFVNLLTYLGYYFVAVLTLTFLALFLVTKQGRLLSVSVLFRTCEYHSQAGSTS